MNRLNENEIQKRLQELRNLKKLHEASREQIRLLREQNQLLMEQLRIKDKIIVKQAEAIETHKLQIEELQRMVFGRKKKKKDDDNDDDFRPKKEKGKSEPRNKDSYKRPVPDEEDITSHEYHNPDHNCPDCGTSLQDRKTVIFYEEDIPLPDKKTKLKQVIKHHTEKGYCPDCRKWHRSMRHPGVDVFIGNRVRLYIAYLSILLRLSFSQIQSFLWDTYRFRISDGEITKILHQTADRLRPEFERIKKRLQDGRGVHLDETSWGDFYLWVMTSVNEGNEDVLYLAGRTRGKGNADELLGDDFNGARVTDAYAVYKNQKGFHQQCWSHPHTKLRELAYSKTLNKEVREHCRETYGEFSITYEKLRKYIEEPFNKQRREKQKQLLFKQIAKWKAPNEKDPKKLQNIKQQFCDYAHEWLTCMDYDGLPCDNNKAERKLRHFVIKRKISFGNKSRKGHETFETLSTVLMTYWKTYKDNFFPELRSLLQGV